MSRKVNSLQSNLSSQRSESLSVSPSYNPLIPSSSVTSATSFTWEDWLSLTDREANQNRQWALGEVVLGYQNVSSLLQFYAKNNHEHLPILDRVTSISELHDSNQFLFWTILRTSMHRHPELSYLFQLLRQPYQHLLMRYLLPTIRDFRTIQAILILCHWPHSGPRQSEDASWQYCGMALNSAMQMGLDKDQPEDISPGFHGKFNLHETTPFSRHMTWLACFYISTSLSVWLGVPPHLSSPAQLNAISAVAKQPHVLPQFMVQVEIQRQVVQYSTALAGDIDASTVSTLSNLFNNELDSLVNSMRELWTPRHEIQLLGAKLYLFSLCITVASKQKEQGASSAISYTSDPARLAVQLGLPAAVSLIHLISKLNKEALESSQNGPEVVHYPKYYFRLVVFAVAFLMKFLSANPQAAQDDRELAISHIANAHQFFASYSPAPDFVEVAAMIAVWAKNLKHEGEEESTTRKTRFGASLLYETIKRFRWPSDQAKEKEAIEVQSVQDEDSKAIALSAPDPNPDPWGPEAYNYFSEFQPGMDALENFQSMSDDMLSEMFRL